MISIKNFSIKKELIAIQLITTFIVLVCFGVFHSLNSFHLFRNSVISQLTSTAQLIGANSTSALNFFDDTAAEVVLSSLKAEKDIVNAWIYDAEGNLFAKYSKTGYTDFSFPKIDKEFYEFKGAYFTLNKRIIQDNDVIGMVSLRLNMNQYRQMLIRDIIIALFVLILGMIIALLLSILSQKTISNPILRLAETVKEVSGTGNYSIRVKREGKNEIGILYDGFNDMLEQIQFREMERDKAGKALHESEAKFRAITENTTDITIIIGEEGNYTYVSPSIKKIAGYSPGDIIGKSIVFFVYSEDMTIVNKTIEKVKKDPGSTILLDEFRGVNKDGQLFYLQGLFTCLLDVPGIDGIVINCRDITESKKAERFLSESEERFRTLFDAAFEGIFIYEKGIILEVNRTAAMMLRCEQEELAGRSIFDVVAEESRDEISQKLAVVSDNPLISLGPYEILSLRKDGTTFPVEIHSKGINFKGKILRLVGFRDISERKRMEQALQESESMFRAIKENTTDITVIVGEEGTYKYVSPSARKILGYSSQEIEGRPPGTLTHPDDLSLLKEFFERASKEHGKTIHIDSFRVKNKDGHWVYFEGLFTSMLDVPGVNGIVVNCRDITERIKADELLAESDRRLRKMNDALVNIAKTKTVVSGDLDATFKEITEAAANNLEIEMCSIWIGNRETLIVECQDFFERSTGKHLRGQKLKAGEQTQYFKIVQENRVISVNDTLTDSRTKDFYRHYFPDIHVASTIIAPIRHHGETIGVLSIDHMGPTRDWTFEEQNFAGSLADIVSIAIETSERIKAEKGLKNRIAFDDLITEISTNFIHLPPSDIDTGIDQALQKAGEFSCVDRAYVFEFDKSKTKMDNTHEWCIEGVKPQIDNLQGVDTDTLPRWMEKLNKFEIINIPDVDNLPEEDAAEKGILRSQNIKSLVVVPMEYYNNLEGFVGFVNVREKKKCSADTILVLNSVGRIIVNALEHKRVHEELRKANEELEQKVEERTKELRQKQTQLVQSEKMASLGNLVAGVAHEINTPLGALKSNNDVFIRSVDKMKTLIADLTGPADTPKDTALTKLFDGIDTLNEVNKTASERIVKIVSSLRTFARLDQAEMDTVDIHEGIESTLTLVHHELKRRIEIHKDFGNLPKISCYPNQLNQIFMNILVNASHAIEDKGDIYIKTYPENNKAVIEINDTGKGIPKDDLNRIFDPGFTTKSKGIGTGLGLSIVYQIIEDHHGSIEVESEIGKGTMFRIILPI